MNTCVTLTKTAQERNKKVMGLMEDRKKKQDRENERREHKIHTGKDRRRMGKKERERNKCPGGMLSRV